MTLQPSEPSFRLSKSRFLAGLQCFKRLYFEIHSPELASKADPERQAIMDMGKEVGEVARQRFPGGHLVEETHRQSSAALKRTAELINDPTVLVVFEGAFVWNNILVRADILERTTDNTWKLIEVKATSKVKPIHLKDLAIQAAVIEGTGLSLSGCVLMHLNTGYLYEGGELDLDQLFTLEDSTDSVKARLPQVHRQVEHMRKMLKESTPPTIVPDGHCHTPYECPFWAHCTKEKPSRWIYFLPGGRQTFTRLSELGIETMDDIPPNFSLTPLQIRVKENKEWISPHLLTHLQSVHYPVHHLDFETCMPAIPLYPQTRPYRPIPVQWSNHIEEKDGQIRHETYLCMDSKDPRSEIAQKVVATLGEGGTICVYSEYERHLLLSLGELFPDLKVQLSRIVDRLWDLLTIIQKHYYHPSFEGSFSIKSVLPALVPALGYEDLDIRNGASASVMYRKMVFEETDLVERAQIGTALHQYCERDTLGMLELRRVLLAKASLLEPPKTKEFP
jgi:predicted RecB family nuclease